MNNPVRQRQWLFPVVNLLILVALLYAGTMGLGSIAPQRVSYTEFLAQVRAGKLSAVEITDQDLIGVKKPDTAKKKGEPAPEERIIATRLPGIDDTSLLKELEERQIKVTGHIERNAWIWGLLGWMLPLLIIGLVYVFGMRRLRQGGGAMTFGRNRAKIYDQSSRVKVTFADVAGVDEAKTELLEIVDFLRRPARYQALGGRIPKGVLLVGPPGTGKTLLAKAVAGEAGVAFFSISGSEFVEMFVGVGAARVRDLFEQAKQKAPCIVFIDELDAIGKSRTSGRGIGFSNEEREQTLNQLLAEVDGFDTSEGVILMAATNQPEVLDAALLRAGRFDRQVLVDRPDLKGREEILQVHARKIHMAPDVDLGIIAARTPGMAGADLANIVNESALLAVRRGSNSVELRDMEEAIDRVMLGLEKKRRVMTPAEKERIAYHESGHTLVALSVQHADPVHRVSIIPRSIGALGYTLQLPTEERFLMTQPELEDRITVLMGGRAAEEIQYNGVVSTGAADDLDRASELARQMVTRFGMSGQLGKLTYGRPLASPFLKSMFTTEERNYSDTTARIIDEESKRIVDAAFERAESILRERDDQLNHLASELMRKETLNKEEVDAVVQSTAPPAPAKQAAGR
ncbi:MAG: ATP-dependent zinc metalloprotease FtsH [Bryobacterales bacterium]|nr:ATP-dependent zinc metalloprotease FtsH [Bryobacterales bacterium]